MCNTLWFKKRTFWITHKLSVPLQIVLFWESSVVSKKKMPETGFWNTMLQITFSLRNLHLETSNCLQNSIVKKSFSTVQNTPEPVCIFPLKKQRLYCINMKYVSNFKKHSSRASVSIIFILLSITILYQHYINISGLTSVYFPVPVTQLQEFNFVQQVF